jgi:hypothetical protein
MTVKELIEALQKLPQDKQVRIYAEDFDRMDEEDRPDPAVFDDTTNDVVWIGWM